MSKGEAKTSAYFDYAAATPLDTRVLHEMVEVAGSFYNPSALYLSARSARGVLHEFRSRVAICLGAQASEIVFTAGATEANNLALQGFIGQHGGLALVSAVEHEAARRPVLAKTIPVDKNGLIDLKAFEHLVHDDVTIVSVMYVSNELGTIQPLKEIAEIIAAVRSDRKRRGVDRPIVLHTDASQAGGYLDLSVNRLGVDLMTINGAKMYGPKQSGCLFVKAGVELEPLIKGGGQEFGLRSGTESLMQTAGFTKALELAVAAQNDESKRVRGLRDTCWKAIQALEVDAQRLGHPKRVAPHILSVRFPGTDNERLVMELDELGYEVAAGSACKASSDEPSLVLKAIGLDRHAAGEVLRFSFGRQTTDRHIVGLVNALDKLLHLKKH